MASADRYWHASWPHRVSPYSGEVGEGTLFDYPSQHGRPDPYEGSQFQYLNSDDSPESRRLRALLEDWYSQHPDPGGGLRARFRKDSAEQHMGAWWELYIFILFRCLGYEVTPSVESPDFRIAKGKSRFQVECIALFGSGDKRSDAQQWLLRCINDIQHPDYYVSVRIVTMADRRVARRKVTPAIREWLASLNYETICATHRNQPQRFTFGETCIDLTPLAVSPDRRGKTTGLVGVGPAVSAFPINSVKDIRKALDKKARQCDGIGDDPLVIAVLNRAIFARHREMEEALFGTTAVAYIPDQPSSSCVIRSQDGYWHPGPPPSGSRVAAVIFGESIGITLTGQILPTMWLNPWAAKLFIERLPFTTYIRRQRLCVSVRRRGLRPCTPHRVADRLAVTPILARLAAVESRGPIPRVF